MIRIKKSPVILKGYSAQKDKLSPGKADGQFTPVELYSPSTLVSGEQVICSPYNFMMIGCTAEGGYIGYGSGSIGENLQVNAKDNSEYLTEETTGQCSGTLLSTSVPPAPPIVCNCKFRLENAPAAQVIHQQVSNALSTEAQTGNVIAVKWGDDRNICEPLKIIADTKQVPENTRVNAMIYRDLKGEVTQVAQVPLLAGKKKGGIKGVLKPSQQAIGFWKFNDDLDNIEIPLQPEKTPILYQVRIDYQDKVINSDAIELDGRLLINLGVPDISIKIIDSALEEHEFTTTDDGLIFPDTALPVGPYWIDRANPYDQVTLDESKTKIIIQSQLLEDLNFYFDTEFINEIKTPDPHVNTFPNFLSPAKAYFNFPYRVINLEKTPEGDYKVPLSLLGEDPDDAIGSDFRAVYDYNKRIRNDYKKTSEDEADIIFPKVRQLCYNHTDTIKDLAYIDRYKVDAISPEYCYLYPNQSVRRSLPPITKSFVGHKHEVKLGCGVELDLSWEAAYACTINFKPLNSVLGNVTYDIDKKEVQIGISYEDYEIGLLVLDPLSNGLNLTSESTITKKIISGSVTVFETERFKITCEFDFLNLGITADDAIDIIKTSEIEFFIESQLKLNIKHNVPGSDKEFFSMKLQTRLEIEFSPYKIFTCPEINNEFAPILLTYMLYKAEVSEKWLEEKWKESIFPKLKDFSIALVAIGGVLLIINYVPVALVATMGLLISTPLIASVNHSSTGDFFLDTEPGITIKSMNENEKQCFLKEIKDGILAPVSMTVDAESTDNKSSKRSHQVNQAKGILLH